MTSSHEIPKEGVCSLCGGHYDPARCCADCNSQLVIPERLRRIIPNSLEQRAGELDCRIDVMCCEEMEDGIDYGPYLLCDAETGAHAWGSGLPLAGVADALGRIEREQAEGYDAWADFGSSWLKLQGIPHNRADTSDRPAGGQPSPPTEPNGGHYGHETRGLLLRAIRIHAG